MVDSNAQQMEWPPNSSPHPRSCHRDRCFCPGLGSSHKADEHRRPLVRTRESSPHKPPGASRRSPCHKNLHEGQEEHPCPPQDGQHNCHSIYKPDGRHKVPDSITGSLRPVALVTLARDNSVSGTPPRCTELQSGRRIQYTTIIGRVDAREFDLSQHHTDSGPLLGGSLRHSSQQSTEEACQLAPRPICDSKGCLYYVVAGGGRVCISPVLPNRQMPAENPPRGVHSGTGNPCVGRPALVPGPIGPPGRIPPAVTNT